MSAFILAPAPSAPPEKALHLLPFSLPPTTTSTTIGAYFQPRAAPPSHPAADAGCLLASFRGRQIVGQRVAVPKGYKGVVLRASGSTSDASASASEPAAPRYPLTPASSIASTSTSEPPAPAGRTRGAGQVALSRPRRRAVTTRARIALDESDDEQDDDADVVAPRKKARVATPKPVTVPDINIVQATPAKPGVDEEHDEEHDDATLAPAAAVVPDGEVKAEKMPPAAPAQEYAADGRPARVLMPVGAFDAFTLWTPDAPLAGYARGAAAAAGEGKEGVEGQGEGEGEGEGTKGEAGWWSATGGGGEGGDEFVRALGEWLGLCEIIHAPVYLDDGDDESDDDE
ncbi:uncharacterized protein LOC62_03G004617 [Vanrija pseudolonga]|uniref:Uncharacterized protein n=1 Tax=Vanrija pseudolonga TaxID=143232 RepID=A0AAF1BLN1_9TREE|nr:hypothetical protein LOC62_03G004617 [Vanrija pseudolonga]